MTEPLEPTEPLVIYGSTGYTGRLVARKAKAEGLRFILAGRNPEKLAAQSEELGGAPWVAATLEDPASMDRMLAGRRAVIHCAGPFFRTWRAMAEACLRKGVHYLDITGEIEVFEGVRSLDEAFRGAGLMAMPGTGFDVVPTDLLAAALKERMPDAVELELAFMAKGTRASHGTASSVASRLGNGGVVRRGGRYVPVPTAWKRREIDFGAGPRSCVSIPWGDVATAYHSTGIPDITVFMAVPPRSIPWLKASNLINPLLRTRWVRGIAQRRIDRGPEGPTESQRERGRSLLWGHVRDAKGRTITARFETAEGYTLTALTCVAIASALLSGTFRPGFQTPSMVYRDPLGRLLELDGRLKVEP
jgi:short subunit dehydrogenase-like uncharacterized protein